MHLLEYSAFMKCLFSKEYEESIEEFMTVKEKYGDSYVMDHTHNFYIGLNYLQLNFQALMLILYSDGNPNPNPNPIIRNPPDYGIFLIIRNPPFLARTDYGLRIIID